MRDKVVLRIKSGVSALLKLGLIKKPRYHPYGVSFIVAVKDEERWIKNPVFNPSKMSPMK